MEDNDMIDLISQLQREGKDLLAVTDEYILVYWYADKSYVSWKYWYSQRLGRYVFEYGDYLSLNNGSVSKNEAIKHFSERINK